MYNAIKSIKRFKTISFLIVIQLSLGIVLLNSVIMQSENKFDKKVAFSSMFNLEDTYLLRVCSQGSEFEDVNEKIKKICDEIYKLKEVKEIEDVYTYFNNPSAVFHFRESVLNSDKYDNLDMILEGRFFTNISVDENFVSRYKFDIIEGRNFNEYDFQKDGTKDTIPIIIGEDYKESMSVGDKILEEITVKYNEAGEAVRKNVQFEVIGIYKKDSLFSIVSKKDLFNSVTFSNALIIVPIVQNLEYFSKYVAINDVGVFIECREDWGKNDLEKEANEIIDRIDPNNKYNIKCEITSLKDNLTNINASFLNDIKLSLFLGVVLIMLSLIGITTTVLGELKNRNEEFGIRLTLGARVKDICKQIILEVFIMMSASVIISSIYLKFINVSYEFTLKQIIINFALICIFTLVVSIIPVIRIKDYQVIELLKGGEK